MSKGKEYDVGYGRPPKHRQFKKGQSGNPRGRPKNTKNFTTDLTEELGEIVIIREGGKTKRVSKQRAAIKALFAKSLKGNVRALGQLFSCLARYLDEEPEAAAEQPLSAEDAEILQRFRQRFMEATDFEGTSPQAPSGDEPTAGESASPAPDKRGRPRRRLGKRRRLKE